LSKVFNFNNTWFAVTSQKFFCGPQVEIPWDKGVKLSGATCTRLKASTDESWRNMPGPYRHV